MFHSTSAGDAHVRLAVSLVAKAKISLDPNGETLTITPGGDEASTHLAAELVAVERGSKEAAAELAGILQLFTPYLQTLISSDLELPPIAIPAVDLGKVSPGFAGRQGRFAGAIKIDAKASRINLEGDVIAH